MQDAPQQTQTPRLALRFERSTAGKLRRTCDLVGPLDPEAARLLDRAHEAAVDDGLLIFDGAEPDEVIAVANDFPNRWGLPRPVIEQLRS